MSEKIMLIVATNEGEWICEENDAELLGQPLKIWYCYPVTQPGLKKYEGEYLLKAFTGVGIQSAEDISQRLCEAIENRKQKSKA